MRRAIYRGTGPISVLTPTGGINLAEGASVDLDEVIGPQGFTVADALDPHLALCVPVEPEAAISARRRSAPVTNETSEE